MGERLRKAQSEAMDWIQGMTDEATEAVAVTVEDAGTALIEAAAAIRARDPERCAAIMAPHLQAISIISSSAVVAAVEIFEMSAADAEDN